jgi:hypothetical protein
MRWLLHERPYKPARINPAAIGAIRPEVIDFSAAMKATRSE